ncbi:MAG: LutB/LldF family L-lactate oxidation iron-sulfur protein [Candidatus Methylacidiphilales bacterium]
MSATAETFQTDSARYGANRDQRVFLRRALGGYYVKRDENKSKFQDWGAARRHAAAVKSEAIDHLDTHLEQFIEKCEAHGTKIFVAANARRACDYIVSVVKAKQARSIIKSKSMTGEEIHLAQALEKEGFEVVESDLGEYIVQLRGEAPFHIVFPAMHLKRGEISRLFQEKLGTAPTDSPEELTMIARHVMRQKYVEAEVGISGVNFAVAETGTIAMCTNEGNGRLTTSLPPTHIAIMGIEKLIPRMEDLALLLPMLATAGSGQQLTCYNNLISGPRKEGESDGPEEFHLIILDNNRTRLLADGEQRDTLNCIRCGACINVCPIFKNIGGHAYNTTYMGPIGSVLTPHLRGLQSWKHLSSASSLCGACTDACPVGIDLHHHLLQNRRNGVMGGAVWWERLLFLGFGWISTRPALFHLAGKIGRTVQRLAAPLMGSALDPARNWTATRTLPEPPPYSFQEYWQDRQTKKHD